MTTNGLAIILLLLGKVELIFSGTPIRIGALYNYDDPSEQEAYIFSKEVVNRGSEILRTWPLEINLKSTQRIDDTSVKVCDIAYENSQTNMTASSRYGVAALFGPREPFSADYVESFASAFDIPHIQIHPVYDLDERVDTNSTIVNLYPDPEELTIAYKDFVEQMGWKEMIILASPTEHLSVMKHVMAFGGPLVKIIKMTNHREALIRIKRMTNAKNIIVHMGVEKVKEFLETAKELDLLSSYKNYFFTTLDMGPIANQIGHLTTGVVNITSYQLVPKSSREIDKMRQHWIDTRRDPNNFNKTMLKTSNALIYDGVQYIAGKLEEQLRKRSDFTTARMQCKGQSKAKRWDYGRALYRSLVPMYERGVTGLINVTDKGRRNEFDLELIEFNVGGEVEKIGRRTKAGLNITKTWNDTLKDMETVLRMSHFKILINPNEPPYAMKRERDANGTFIPQGSNRRYYGYCIDMMEKIAAKLGIQNYSFVEQKEGSKKRESDGKWMGIVGDLIDKKADLGLTPVTITSDRAEVVDFSVPYLSLGISILFKKPEEQQKKMFSFLDPFSNEIWACVISMMLGTSIIMFCVGRFSPGQWDNPHPCQPEVDLLENDMTLHNSVWFVLGSFLQQGTEIAPKSAPTRIIASAWWLFCLISVASYTANLAAFLTTSKMKMPIKNAEDLSKQVAIKYGCFGGGATRMFFKNSKISTFSTMNSFMEQNPDVLMGTEEGIKRVKQGNYAYLMESTSLRYQLSKPENCDLTEIGNELSDSFFAIAFPKGSIFTDVFSEAILSLLEDQELLRLYNQHWDVEDNSCKTCSNMKGGSQIFTINQDPCKGGKSTSTIASSQLGLSSLMGVFVILFSMLAAGGIICIIHFCAHTFIQAKKRRRNFGKDLRAEVKFATYCCGEEEKPTDLSRGKRADDNQIDDNSLGRSLRSLSLSLGSLKTTTSSRYPHSLDVTRETHMPDSSDEESLHTVMSRKRRH